MPSSNHRHVSLIAVVFVVGALTATALGGFPAIAGSASQGRTTPSPIIKTGAKDGPFPVQGGNLLRQVAALRLGAGKYTIFAKVELQNLDSIDERIGCSLVAGANHDSGNALIPAAGAQISDDTVSMNVSHVFSVAGAARVLCATNGPAHTAQGFDLKITAIRAGTLTQVDL